MTALQELGYSTNWQVLNAKPQNRERTIVEALNGVEFDFSKLERKSPIAIKDILDKYDDFEYLDENEYTLIDNPKRQQSSLIFAGYRNKNMRTKGVRENTEHLSRVHKQPNRIYHQVELENLLLESAIN